MAIANSEFFVLEDRPDARLVVAFRDGLGREIGQALEFAEFAANSDLGGPTVTFEMPIALFNNRADDSVFIHLYADGQEIATTYPLGTVTPAFAALQTCMNTSGLPSAPRGPLLSPTNFSAVVRLDYSNQYWPVMDFGTHCRLAKPIQNDRGLLFIYEDRETMSFKRLGAIQPKRSQ